MNKKIIIGIGILVIIVVIFLMMTKGSATGKVVQDSIEISEDTNTIKIPLSQITKKAKWHEYDSNGVQVKYFTVKADDGSVKTAFDACDVCYRSKKGYSQQGEDMVCNNCGNHYAINGLGTKNIKGGGCWPGYLPNKVEGDFLVIKKSDLEAGRYRF